jgi:hypothetical protein
MIVDWKGYSHQADMEAIVQDDLEDAVRVMGERTITTNKQVKVSRRTLEYKLNLDTGRRHRRGCPRDHHQITITLTIKKGNALA